MVKRLEPEEKERRKQARKQKRSESPTAIAEKRKEPKAELIQPLAVEIAFPAIMDLKQALAFDADGNLIIGIQFKAKVDQYEIFRLVNLLKQPHGNLYATIGSPQSAMDFKFDTKKDMVEVIKAARTLPLDKALEEAEEAAEPPFPEPKAVKIQEVAFNHIPKESKPYGVVIDYVVDGAGKTHTVAGRGKNPTEAVMAGVKATNALPADLKEPFEVTAALEQMDPSPACYKLIRAIEVGSFDDGPVQNKGEKQSKKVK